MTGKKSKYRKILRAVIITASLLWAGNPVKTAAEETTETGNYILIDEIPQSVTFYEVNRVDQTNTSTGWTYAEEKITVTTDGSYKVYKNTATNYYYYYYEIEHTAIRPYHSTPIQSLSSKYKTGPYEYYYGIMELSYKWDSGNRYYNTICVSNFYQGKQTIHFATDSTLYDLNNLTKIEWQKGVFTYWSYYDKESSGGSGTDAETAQNITDILNELKADPEITEEMATSTTQNNEALEEIAQQEQEITDAANENIEQIDPNGVFQNELFTSGKLGNALMWIREIHRQTIEATQIGNIVSVTLILGLAAYMIGRRGG